MLALLVSIVVALLIAGIALWLIGLLPLDPTIHTLIRGAVIICAVIYVLYAFWVTFGHRVPIVH